MLDKLLVLIKGSDHVGSLKSRSAKKAFPIFKAGASEKFNNKLIKHV